jgi:hypothetical protein
MPYKETSQDQAYLRRAFDGEVIGDGMIQIRLLVDRLREIRQIATDPAFESDAMSWIEQLSSRPLPETQPVVRPVSMCIECVAKKLARQTKAAAYYRAAVLQRADPSQIPPHVPCRVRLNRRITGDWPVGHKTAAGPGEMDCTVNKLGAVSVLADDGKQLGLRLDEFEIVEWKENP